MNKITVALLGDIAPFGRYCVSKSNGDFKGFSEASDFLKNFDVVIGNLEAPFVSSGRARGFKSAHVSLKEENVEILKFLGVTHVSLANNHICDFGDDAVLRTIEILEENGIGWFGVNGKIEKVEINHQKIAMLGYCSFNTNPSKGKKYNINLLDVDEVKLQIDGVSQEGFFPLLSIHSGQEHIHFPSSDDVEFARKIAGNVDYIYHGHHPHVVQGCENYLGSLIYYSLGNFIFDDVYTPRDKNKPLIKLSEENKTGIIAAIDIGDQEVKGHAAIPVYLSQQSMVIGDQVKGFSMDLYNEKLSSAGTEEYNSTRNSLISSFIEGRKKLRNLKWYLKRINFNSVGIIILSRINAAKYKKHFLKKLDFL